MRLQTKKRGWQTKEGPDDCSSGGQTVHSGMEKRQPLFLGSFVAFYYLIHIYLLHGLAVIAAMLLGYPASDMTNFTNWVTSNPQLKGYGFGLGVVYAVWIAVVIALYPLCRRFDTYKRSHQAQKPWLSYL